MVNGTDKDSKIHDKYMREAKAIRHLNNLEIHTIMQIDMNTTVMKVIGGWIYYGHGCGVFVPEKR